MPAPPSVLATPPRPSTIRRAPRDAAAATSSPTPKLVAVSGSAAPPGSRTRPAACAASMIAVPSRQANSASTGRPAGPRTRQPDRLVAGGDGRGHGAVPAVGDGNLLDGEAGARPAQSRGQMRGSLGRGERALELVRGHHHVPGLRLRLLPRGWCLRPPVAWPVLWANHLLTGGTGPVTLGTRA